MPDMFNKRSMEERIGEMEKSTTLYHLKEVEKYFLKTIKKYKIEHAYDVIANELPYFKTFNYTEWAHSFIIHPLQQEMRLWQMEEAYADKCEHKVDYVDYFKNRILNKQSNKYNHIIDNVDVEYRENIVVLVGSNKLKERICLNKLNWIKETYEDDVFFKPHPLTTHQLVGELKDMFGEDMVLERDADMYDYMVHADTVFTSTMSESAVYAAALGKDIEPIDAYQEADRGSFYHINRYLFLSEDPAEWVNTTLNSYKSGIINPEVDEKWQEKMRDYLDYMMDKRDKFKDKYV